MMRPTLANEVYAPREAKLFARVVQQYPPRRVAFAVLPSLIGVAAFLAGALTAIAVLSQP